MALPSGRAATPAATPRPQAGTGESTMRGGPRGVVLLVDDSRLVRDIIGASLRTAGYTVQEAEDGAAAIGMLEVGRYDVVLTDLRMPGIDGFGVLEVVRQRQPDAELIVLTGTHAQDINTAVRALRLGAHDFLMKPLAGADQAVLSVDRAVEKKRQREALREAEARYGQLFDRVPIGLYRTSAEGRFLEANPALVQMLGCASREALLASDAASFHVEGSGRRRWLAMVERQGVVKQHEVALRRRDGSALWVEENARAVRDADGRLLYIEGSLQDITERKQAEEALRAQTAQLRQSQKMEAVGRLAGGVAHDFNNLLTVITGYGDLLLKELPESHPRRRKVDEILKAAGRASDLVRQLLAFGRRQMVHPSVLDLNAVVADMGSLLRRLIGEDVELQTTLQPRLGRTTADRGQLEQVLMNLAVNSRDAMPAGGRLTIETADVELDEAFVQGHVGATGGPHVMLAVADTGEGMDEQTQSHVFEPFFTTKEMGKGTGLGLATVYGIVKQAGGYIALESRPGHGTTFRIYLPRTQAAPSAKLPRIEGGARQGSETILLVEDEDMVRELAQQALELHGYGVVAAASGSEALAAAERHAGAIALVVTDVVMPGMNGPQLAERLAAARPGIRVLYMSGYNDTPSTRAVEGSCGGLLQKPFTVEQLACRVRQVLDERPAALPRRA
jgi:PAS domain S-box-containing protein